MRPIPGFATMFLVAGCSSIGPRRPALPPAGWVSIAPEDTGRQARECEYFARNEWRVRLSGDSTHLLLVPALQWTPRTSLSITGGRFEGWNGGEFGGGIYWRPESGVGDTLSAQNLVAFVKTSGRTLALVAWLI